MQICNFEVLYYFKQREYRKKTNKCQQPPLGIYWAIRIFMVTNLEPIRKPLFFEIGCPITALRHGGREGFRIGS
jgi:hypothetical protein